jgi:hypothetical protein
LIPESEIPSASNELTEPPESLLLALRIFLLGVAIGLVSDEGRGNRSMLIHPSQRTMAHGQYHNWVRVVTEQWGEILRLPERDPDRLDLLNDFRAGYYDLCSTVQALPSFEELSKRLKHAIRQTRVEEVNAKAGSTPEIDWHATYPFILVGGQAMDRGFTVEGLTVTYMPRGLGIGNADNVQQRARFLGYKRQYLGLCRVFVESAAHSAYRGYVSHEEDVRARLIAHRSSGRPLTEWKREFFLTRNLKPTRHSVLGLDYMRVRFGDDWWYPATVLEAPETLDLNKKTVEAFVETLSLEPDIGHRNRTRIQQHEVDMAVPLAHAFEDLLTQYRVAGAEESQRLTAILILIQDLLEERPNTHCVVYRMSKGAVRERGLDEKGQIKNLFQGAHPDKLGIVYPGDRKIRSDGEITIQIHFLDLLDGQKEVASEVPVLAIWIPAALSRDLIVQEQLA